jgi:hypothetical protein
MTFLILEDVASEQVRSLCCLSSPSHSSLVFNVVHKIHVLIKYFSTDVFTITTERDCRISHCYLSTNISGPLVIIVCPSTKSVAPICTAFMKRLVLRHLSKMIHSFIGEKCSIST